MKRIVVFALACLLTSVSAYAERIPLACQENARGGLKWESGRWVSKLFYEEKFILVQEGPTLNVDAVGKILGGFLPTCDVLKPGVVTCHDSSGGFLIFDIQSKRGTVAQIFGGISTNVTYKDTLHVAPFTCQTF
jgi:hypothetical protein